jgi:hypothetical protein
MADDSDDEQPVSKQKKTTFFLSSLKKLELIFQSELNVFLFFFLFKFELLQ